MMPTDPAAAPEKDTDRIIARLGVIAELVDHRMPAPMRPLLAQRSNSAAAVSGTPTVLDLGYPSSGRAWSVLAVSVMGSDDHTSLAGVSPTVYVGDPATYGPGQCVVPSNGNTVPNVSTFTPGVVWVRGEHLFVVVYGAATGQILTAVARLLDYPEAAAFADRIM